jgi:hypothetical protein
MPYPLEPNIAAAVSSALRSDVTSFDDLVLEIVDQESNRTADQAVNEESENACERLKRAIDDLCRGGLVKRGWRVTLEPSPIEFLSEPPLVDGVWIDRMAVELAESAATLGERRIKLEVPSGLPSAGTAAASPHKGNSGRTRAGGPERR